MKTSFLRIFVFMAGFAGLAASAKAQEPDRIQVKIPFSFVAAGETHPAGEYRVTRLRDEGARVLLLINTENRADTVMLFPETQETSHGKAQLAFATIADEHFLSRIQTEDYTYSLSVPQTEALLAAVPSKGSNRGMAPSSSSSGSN